MEQVTDADREQAKIDMEQKFIDAIAYSEVKLTDGEVKHCFGGAVISAKE